jgi:spore cortex formation protein SpoVR/YcgB (stage V sporulation)
MVERFQKQIEAKAYALGLRFPSVDYVITTPARMQEIAACRGIPDRYCYPWVSDALARNEATPLEIVVCDRPAIAYVNESALTDEESVRRIIAHVCGHADLFFQHHAFAGHHGAMLGKRGRTRLQLIERRVGRRALWAFLDECAEHEKRDTVRLSEPWHMVALDVLETERAYLAPFQSCQVLAEGWAAFWERTLLASIDETKPNDFTPPEAEPYRLGFAFVCALSHVGKLWKVYDDYSDLVLFNEFWDPAFCEREGYPYQKPGDGFNFKHFKHLLINRKT